MSDAEAYEFYANPENRRLTGTPRKRAGQRLTAMSSVRFAPESIEAARELAAREGVTVGSWIRRLVQREIDEPKPSKVEVEIAGLSEPLGLPSEALQSLFAALMPALIQHGSVELRIGPMGVSGGTAGFTTTAPVNVVSARESERQRRAWLDEHRGELEVVPGSGRAVAPRAIPSSLSQQPRTFTCPHFSVSNAASASCGTCGPLAA